MSKVRDWFEDHSVVACIGILLLISLGIDIVADLFGKTYEDFRQNKHPYTMAIEEFERLCGDYKVQSEDEYSAEFCRFYSSRNEAINNFMTLTHICDGLYANGKIWHIYALGKERVYRCWDCDQNIIAIRLVKHRRIGINWRAEYELDFYVEK